MTEVLDQRLIGYLRWRFFRRRQHDEGLLRLLREEIQRRLPDQIVITGDLTHFGHPQEFRRVASWLKTLPPGRVTVVPGNHDAYRWGPWEETFGLLESYFRGDEGGEGEDLFSFFPAVRRRGPVVFLGLSSACPNVPPLAVGRLGGEQISRLQKVLKKNRGLFRVLLIHHPPVPRVVGSRKALQDLAPLLAVLAEDPPELILFGHTHRRHFLVLGRSLVFGAPAVTSMKKDQQHRAGYFLFELIDQKLRVKEMILSSSGRFFLPYSEREFSLWF